VRKTPGEGEGKGKTYLLRGDRLLRGLGELLDSLGVVAQILLAADKDDGKALAEVENFGNPLRTSVSTLTLDAQHAIRKSPTFSWTLSSESGESTAKQIKMTCESGYDKGRRRS
jgi:hypothetical protein